MKKQKKYISTVKTVNQELNVNTAILADFQGPKIRIGELKKPLKISIGEELLFTTKNQKTNQIYISYKGFARDVERGEYILIDDGKIKLKVCRVKQKRSSKN